MMRSVPSRRTVLTGMLSGALSGALAALAAGCSSPEPTYYALAALPGPAAPGGPRTVELRRPGLAGYLDRPAIVRAGRDYQLRVAGNERWGEPFGDLVARILAEDLTGRLPGTTVFTSAGSISTDADAAVELDVQRFDQDVGGEVVLLVQVAVQRGRGRSPAVSRTVRLTSRPASDSTPALVAAMSVVLGQFADILAGVLRSVGSGPLPTGS